MDEDAKVYEEVRYTLTRLATALVGPAEAEDVVATVVLRTLERTGGLAGLREPKPYLVKSVINEARSRYRHSRLVRDRIVLGADDNLPRPDYQDQLLDLVASLPPRQRAATFLVHWEGHTSTSAAALMGCRPATVRRYLHLAHKALRRVIDD